MARSPIVASFDAKATAILAKLYTHEITLKRTAYTRTNAWEAPTASTDTTEADIKAAVLGPGTRRFNGELVEQDERVVYVDKASITTVIDTETVIVIDGEDHPVLRVVGFPEGANASAYEIIVRIN